MQAAIDKAGRLVIPKALRDVVGLSEGAVEIVVEGAGLRIEAPPGGVVAEEDGWLVVSAAGALVTDDDVRELRLADQR